MRGAVDRKAVLEAILPYDGWHVDSRYEEFLLNSSADVNVRNMICIKRIRE